MIIFYDFECTRLHLETTPMSLGLVSYDRSHEFYAEFTDYDSSQLDDWLREHILGNFTQSEMKDRNLEARGNKLLLKGEADWEV